MIALCRRVVVVLVILLGERIALGYVALLDDSDSYFTRCINEKVWLQEFNVSQRRILQEKKDFRAILIRPHSLVGIGNRLNAIRAGFFFALATESLLAIDYEEPMALRLLPRLVQWNTELWPKHIADILHSSKKKKNSIHLRNPKNAQHLARMFPHPSILSKYSIVVLDGWNNDLVTTSLPHLAPAWSITGYQGSAKDAACMAAALFKPSFNFNREIRNAIFSIKHETKSSGQILSTAFHIRTNREFSDPTYVQNRLASRRVRRPHAAPEESCDDFSCWLTTASRFISCATALSRNRTTFKSSSSSSSQPTWLFASDNHDFVSALIDHFTQIHVAQRFVALPKHIRFHSGLRRQSQNLSSSANASGGGPLLDLMLVASASFFIGTAGSSFSTHALAFGGHVYPPNKPPLTAILFRTPFVKGPPAQDPSALDLPHSELAANRLCSSFSAKVTGGDLT